MSVPESRLTLLVLAKCRGGEWTKISDRELAALTGLSSAAFEKGLKEMLARGFVLRRRTKKGFEYRVPWGALGLLPDSRPCVVSTANPVELEYYFARTGFLDLMPTAVEIAAEMNYHQEEIIEAICRVADKLKSDPPTRNRLGWFRKVYREKLQEARAELLAFSIKKSRLIFLSQEPLR